MGRIMVELPGIKEPERKKNYYKVLPTWNLGNIQRKRRCFIPAIG